MSIAERKERQKIELRTKILDAARTLFLEQGYEQTSIRNIADRIEYSPTTIYLYFKDKDDVFYALHQDGFALLRQFMRPLEHVSDPFERLKALSKVYTTFAMENTELYDLMFTMPAPMKALAEKEEWTEGDNAFNFLLQTVRECQSQGYFEGMDAEVLSYTVWSMVHGICSLEIRGRCVKVLSEATYENIVSKATAQVVEILDRMHTKR
ncbi:TetR/AcrR family transcriptional regulator [Dawidia soli]|uniref:TetR/AcrR family transcriptional regulator n=1 Tax=Dawidia soli TaxID=2782352 RepID=A0AAP2D484_9BACT|nr:TetR/AcrR family transcriptional regulator [Dawidia soli]MBT1685036.1 TetR/AcrR family transcriptional regulator [Dawidia soli]